MSSATRASCGGRALALLIAARVASGGLVAAQASKSPLDPAFRLPAGGVAIAGPVIDASSAPTVAWLLSEDLSLYALAESGSLAARIDLSGAATAEGPFAARPDRVLAVDTFGRAVLRFGGTELAVYTRLGTRAWLCPLDASGTASDYPPFFGSDGRFFVPSGGRLLCFNPAGLRLWSLALPSALSCRPSVDGAGRACLGLEDGRILVVSPYGEIVRALSPPPAPPATSGALSPSAQGALSPAKPGALSPPRALAPIFPSAKGRPLLAAGLADGSLLFIGTDGEVAAHWRLAAPPSAIVVRGDSVYALDEGGTVYAVGLDGSIKWRAATGCAKGGLTLFPERLVATSAGRALSLTLGGEAYREISIPRASGFPAVSPAGLAFSAGEDWVLAAYRFERPLGSPFLASPSAYPDLPDVASRELQFDPRAADSGQQMIRLTDIEKSLRSGTMGKAEPEAAAYCAAVLSGALERNLDEAERRRSANPLPKAKAAYLLGSLGSPLYREPLIRVIDSAQADSSVRTAACEALADMGLDPDGASMAAFLAAAARSGDERDGLVLISAVEGLTLRSGRQPSGDALRALARLCVAPYGPTVRTRAAAALERIAGLSK